MSERGRKAKIESSPETVWMEEERRKAIDYLAAEDCKHGGVAEWPAFHVDLHLALWAVESTRHAGRVGWWVISGDVPTDYMSSSDGEHPQDALRYFAAEWMEMAGYMRRGEEHPTMAMGNPEDWPEIAELLEQRSQILEEYAADEAVWGDA